MKEILKKLFKLFGYQLNKYISDEEINYQKKSFSQCGEDLIVQYIFNLRGISSPSYLDIGANHPFKINNTALFYKNGSRGINIEANSLLINSFNAYRPEDINLNIGVGDISEVMNFYIMQDNTLSTFSLEEYDNLKNHGKTLKEVKSVQLKGIMSIIKEYCKGVFPDFLSIDVEGMDLRILEKIEFEKSAPKVICVESAEFSPIGAGSRRNELIDFLISKNYYEYANTNLNAIMVRKDFWFINE